MLSVSERTRVTESTEEKPSPKAPDGWMWITRSFGLDCCWGCGFSVWIATKALLLTHDIINTDQHSTGVNTQLHRSVCVCVVRTRAAFGSVHLS